PLVTPARPGDRQTNEPPSNAESHHPPARPYQGTRWDDARDDVHAAQAVETRLALRERAAEHIDGQQRQNRREREQIRIVERHVGHHGSGPRRAASISSAKSMSAAKYSGHRKSSVYRTYARVRTGSRSSWSISW